MLTEPFYCAHIENKDLGVGRVVGSEFVPSRVENSDEIITVYMFIVLWDNADSPSFHQGSEIQHYYDFQELDEEEEEEDDDTVQQEIPLENSEELVNENEINDSDLDDSDESEDSHGVETLN